MDPPAPFIRTAPGQTRTAQAANCTRPYWIWWYSQHGMACNPTAATNPQPPYSVIQSDVNDGYSYYDALDVNLSHAFSRRLTMLASYTWSHAIDNVDPDTTSQNPNDPNFTGKMENANAIFDQRQRFVLSGVCVLPVKIHIGGVATLASGLPYNIHHRRHQRGDTGATTDRPVINGVVDRPQCRSAGAHLRGLAVGRAAVHAVAANACASNRASRFSTLQSRQFRRLQRNLRQWSHARPWLRRAARGNYQPTSARSMQFSVKLAF